MKKINLIIIILFIFLSVFLLFTFNKENNELKTIKSDRQLLKIYDGESEPIVKYIFTMPFSLLFTYNTRNSYVKSTAGVAQSATNFHELDTIVSNVTESTATASNSKDYSTTNIQVENVDEADIIKTDGDYIYSLSNNNVIITNVTNPEEIKIEAKITNSNNTIPEDLILYENKLIVISTTNSNSSSYYTYYNNSNTEVKVYDITDKSKPVVVKSYELYEPYYTSRCIDNKLYVISSGSLRKNNNNKIERAYKEDYSEKEIKLKNIKYLKDIETSIQTIISFVDLNNIKEDIDVNSYLIDISNSYVSEKAIYLLNQEYEYKNNNLPISSIFGIEGIFGAFTYEEEYYTRGYQTEIYKFDILENGKVSYNAKNKIAGRTINQYSLDEQDGKLRVALYDNNGARVAIFDKELKQIGISDYVAKGETMYSSRFMGNKAYLVTYKTMDPLFVIDLSDETKPKVLGELEIPGYSTYLHPYDENHIIGIGMQTEEVVNRNSNGKVMSKTARITGMKMALFDVSNVTNPVQISETVIGDRRTTSAILTNPKALLFSKERELIAIPVNNYSEDFEITSSNETYSSIISSYQNYNKTYVAEGYFVYKINLEDGFNLKGVITHDVVKNKSSYYYNNSKLLRGLYIENNLYTVSETEVKVNNLETLDLINELKIK